MIDFELPEEIVAARDKMHALAANHMRPIAREYDEREHEKPWDFINLLWEDTKKEMASQLRALEQTEEELAEAKKKSVEKAGGQPMVLNAVLDIFRGHNTYFFLFFGRPARRGFSQRPVNSAALSRKSVSFHRNMRIDLTPRCVT